MRIVPEWSGIMRCGVETTGVVSTKAGWVVV
jgi:hypothetical protein